MSEPIKKTDNQNNDWLENLLSQTNFDSKISDLIPLYEGTLPDRKVSNPHITEELKNQATHQLLKLIKDKDPGIRQSAAFGLTGSQDLDVQRNLVELAKDKQEPFEYRLAALHALKATPNVEIQRELALFFTNPHSARSYLSNSSIDEPSEDRNNLKHSSRLSNKIAAVENRQKLLIAAAESLGKITSPEIITILSKAAPGGLFRDIQDLFTGISETDKEFSLNAVLSNLFNSCEVHAPKVISKFIFAGLRSDMEYLYQTALKTAACNPKNLTPKIHGEIINAALQVDPKEFRTHTLVTLGEILSQVKSKAVTKATQKLLNSSSPAKRIIGIIAAADSENINHIKLVINILNKSQDPTEQFLSIKTLKSCMGRGEPAHSLVREALLGNLFFSDNLEPQSKAYLIRSLAGCDNKSYLDVCIETLSDRSDHLSSAAMFALSRDNSEEITHKLLGILELKEERNNILKSKAAEVLSNRSDPSATKHLRQTLEMGNDLECIYAMAALRGTNDPSSLEHLLDIVGDRSRHFETRADAIYNLDKSINQRENKLKDSFIRKTANLLGQIIANPIEDKMVKLSAINALPPSSPFRVVKELMTLFKKGDSDVAITALNKLTAFDHEPVKKLFIDLYTKGSNPHHQNIALGYIAKKIAPAEGMKILIRDIFEPTSEHRASACRAFRELFLTEYN
jgi:HEAT repeat protein